MEPKQTQLSPNRAHNGHVESRLLYLALHSQKVGPLAHIKRDAQWTLVQAIQNWKFSNFESKRGKAFVGQEATN